MKIPPCLSPSTASGAALCSLLLTLGLLQGCSEGASSDASPGGDSTTAAPRPAGEASGQARDAIPPIRVVPSILNWGTTDPETKVDGSVELENISNEPLTIVTVQSSCACTTTRSLDGQTIPPGGRVTLEAQLDPQNSVGRKTTRIKVLVEGYSKVLEFDGTAEVSRPVRIRPQYINTVGEPNDPNSNAVVNQTGTLMVSSLDRQPFRVLSVQGRPPVYGASKEATTGPRVQHLLVYNIEDYRQPDGRYERYVVVETDREDAPLVEILLRHRNSALDIDRRFKLKSYMLNLGRTPPGGSIEKVHSSREASLTGPIVSATTDEPGITVEVASQEILESEDELAATYRFTVDPDKPEGMYYFPLKIQASNRADIVVPAFISVRSPAGTSPVSE